MSATTSTFTYSRRRARWAVKRWWWRQRARLRWLTLALRGRLIELHPDRLDGIDGEPPHFVRYDLARTPHEVRQLLVAEWGYADEDDLGAPLGEITRVWMRHSPGSGPWPEEDGWYLPVFEGSPGAVPYWRVDE